MSKDHKETLKCHFYGFVVLWREDIEVISNYVGSFIEVENLLWVARVGQIREDVADLSLNVIPVSLKQMQNVLQHTFPSQDGLNLKFISSCNVRHYPASFSPHYFLIMIQDLLQRS